MHVYCSLEVSDLRKKKKRNDSQFIAKATRAVSALSKRTTPSSLPLFQRAERRRDDGKSEARTRCTRDARNAPCSNRFSTVARSSLTNQTLTSADASRQSNLSRKTLRRGQDDEWSELPMSPSSSSKKLRNFVFYYTNLSSIFE